MADVALEREAPPSTAGWRTRRASDARPPAMRGMPYLTLAVFLVAVALLRQYGDVGLGDSDLINTWLFYSVIVVGFYFVFGVAGQFAFSQAAFAAVGGYSSAWATREAPFGTDTFWIGLVFGVLVACVIATVFALLMRRASEFYLAIATLGLSEILLEVIRRWTDFSGALGGDTTAGIRPITIFGFEITAGNGYRIFWVWLAALALVMLLAVFVARSPLQREVIAGRDQHLVAANLGVPVLMRRVTMFVLGSAIAAAAGAVFVHTKGFANADSFDINLGLGIFVMLILGGLDSRWGPVVGAAFYVFVPQWLQGGVLGVSGPTLTIHVFGQDHRAGDFRDIFFGVLLVVTMIVFPEGLVGVGRLVRAVTFGRLRSQRRTWLSDFLGLTPRRASRERPSEPEVTEQPPVRSVAADEAARVPPDGAAVGAEPSVPLLEARSVKVRFGGVVAVDGVDLALHEDEILGLVGPNGSGKTTFLNALTGIVDAEGEERVRGERIRLGRPGRVRALGILRTFQSPQTYAHLTCLEDVALSTPDRRFTGLAAATFARPPMNGHERRRWVGALAALDRVGLATSADEPTSRLSYGQRRMLELARAMHAEPRALLLDEPSAGLNAAETEALAEQLRRLAREGVAILVVDHKLDFITSLCTRVAVLELGQLVAVGPADVVFADPRVVDAYLGVEEDS
jgi:ABC-type branched-subunit amino acid transport system ATPase component/ABC-type branched-subunit amino acid transport system permease subunit